MEQVLVTGANKGIGLAVVKAILSFQTNTFVYLGTRDVANGKAALESIEPNLRERVEILQIDVSSDESVKGAGEILRKKQVSLHGIVNNAGVYLSDQIQKVLDVNLLGVMRVNDEFLSLVKDGGRVVHVSSGAAPSFVEECDQDKQSLFTNMNPSKQDVDAMIETFMNMSDESALKESGYGGTAYGLSKACLNVYNRYLSLKHPNLIINACSPGFIETDLTQVFISNGRTAADMGMKKPEEGTKAIMHLLFGNPNVSGAYFGSDALRSPIDRYRSPGDPEYKP